ncbi:MAG: M1 family metallopeptidase [Chloroflexi bacterium]|nr:M1 family metallopeptidase [Chloroflexota bacterium]
MTTPSEFQLPPHVRPLKYSLSLTPDLERFTFKGEETVEVEVTKPTSEVVLNAVDIRVQTAAVRLGDGTTVTPVETRYDESAETVTFVFGGQLPVGQAKLELAFTGELHDRLHGFYRSVYRSATDGAERTLATTQFEATDARRAFPCWDEPALKASFEVALVVPSQLSVVSNTSIASENPAEPGRKRVQFRETPLMSTYLLAFIVGDLEYVEGASSAGTAIRVWTTRGKAEQGRYALEVAIRLLDYYNDYFGIPYPLEKLDHLAIPDFAAGAMENWGAVTYRETALLFDPANSAPGTRQRIAEVVAHEMAHMWFGDLVTMAWWNDLWLNESFASWMATKAVDHLSPEWDMWTQFVSHDVNAGLGLDALENSHPIEAEVRNPAEISQLFDAISYSKGASIIRMLEQFIGPERFRKGLYSYLSGHEYGNARGRDLWEAMEEASGQPVIRMMESWIRQTGFPVIQTDVRREGGKVAVHVSQQRFLYNMPGQDPTVWEVPVSVAAQGSAEAKTQLLSGREGTVTLEPAQGAGWVKVNSGQTGFYRVQYTDEEWGRLIPAVESLELSAADRLGLQSDAYALARAGLIPATRFLDLARAYRNEQEYTVWSDLTAGLRQMDFLLSEEPYHGQYQAFARELLRSIVQKVGWEAHSGEGHLQTLLRSTVLDGIGSFGEPDTLAEAEQRFRRLAEEPSSLAPELRSVVYGLAAQAGDGATHDMLRRMAGEASLQEEKVRLLMSMARFRERSLLERTIQMALTAEVQPQDTVTLVGAVAANRYGGREIAWEYVQSNWAEFDRRYGSGGFAMMRLVSITGGFTTQEARRDVERFFKSHPTPAATRTIQQSLERIDLNIRWLERNRRELAKWFGG